MKYWFKKKFNIKKMLTNYIKKLSSDNVLV